MKLGKLSLTAAGMQMEKKKEFCENLLESRVVDVIVKVELQ